MTIREKHKFYDTITNLCCPYCLAELGEEPQIWYRDLLSEHKELKRRHAELVGRLDRQIELNRLIAELISRYFEKKDAAEKDCQSSAYSAEAALREYGDKS